MFYIMKNLNSKQYSLFLTFFLIIIPSLIVFVKLCSIVIAIFALFCLLFYKELSYSKISIILFSIIVSPLLLEILMFWNNNSYLLGIKSLEKYISLLIFPLFILGNFKKIDFNKTIQIYSFVMTIIMTFFLVRFIVVFPQYINKYLNGIHLWEMGYVFSNSFGIHAPALNMHLAFVSVSSFYMIFNNFKERKIIFIKFISLIVFLISLFFVLFVNTRMALFQVIIGYLIVFFYEIVKKYNIKTAFCLFSLFFALLFSIIFIFVKNDSYMEEKYSNVTFAYMDKIGKLDELNHPETIVFNSLVTRVSIWKSAWELSVKNLPFGVGSSDGKTELIKYFKKTDQKFLSKYEFPTHNQYLDFLLKFGILGLLVILLYIFTIGYLGYKTQNPIIIFFFLLFFTSNITDDFLIRFDGIAFSGFWFSIFGGFWLKELT